MSSAGDQCSSISTFGWACLKTASGPVRVRKVSDASFEGYRGRYLFHCHNAEHEDMGMMANLEIV
ncbi:multicopper oxidase domain-containing protein [Nonomuraea sp. NPDC050663]|uniref:multicopper oxidase domain-containing protein n=1 Tax=Nonomuraea sp. NPDC050663 TaxID=3364370 RepID=UPI0037BCECB1